MPYDALGNYIPGDDEPSLDEMRLALMQKSQPSYAQIPTQGYPQAPAPQRPLDTATQTLQQVATKYNPLMLMKSMREGVGSTVVNPVVAGLQGVATELQQPEFWQAGRTQPTGIAERVATDFMQRNAPTTPMAQEFTEAVGKYTQDLPAYLGHLSTNRPVLTPNDIRVMGAEATRLGRQIRDIPSDFANAQAGVQRIDPITGQPTMGTKLQAGAESIGDLMERRRMQGLAPIPGLPETMVPETAMYAVRPAGSRIALPQVPGTKSLTDVPLNRAPYSVLADIVEDPKQPLPPEQVERVFENIRIQKNINSDAFNEWSLRKMQELYPDAPTPQDAIDAWGNQFSNRDARANAMLQWYDEFLASPEGQASPMAQLPSSDEIQARHKAASEWLYGPWLNYINKHVGTSGDPALKLASQGLTYSPAAVVKESVRELVDTEELAKLRKKAGMPALGEVGPKLQEKLKELSAAEADLAKWQTRREAYRDIAMRQGLEDPAQLPDFAATTVPIEKLVRDISKLEEDVGNLRLGANYEALADTAISVRTQPEALARLDYADRQFYPSITRARPEDLIYGIPGTGRLQNLGLDRLAHDVYDNVMSGKIPKEQLPKLSIDKIIREEAIPRIKKEKAEALLQKEYKTNAERVMAQTLADNAPPENYFGNIGVIELSQKSGLDLDQMTKILSQATTVLDHCIAQGGSAGSNVNNLWHPQHKRTYEPIYDVVTGERNPRAQRDVSSYATGVVKGGDMIADIRDRNTGVPIATLELSKSHDDADGTTKYHIGWASGARNRDVDPKYADSIKEYLNSRSDMIYSAGTNLLAHTGIHDTRNTAAADMGRAAGVTTEQVRAIDFSSLPRFATKEDIKAYADGVMQAQQVTEAQAPARPGFSPTQVMRDVESAIDNAMDFALTNYDEETTNFVGQVIRDRLSTARLVSLSDPVAAQEYLDSAITELYDWSNNSQMSNSVRRQDTAQAIYNLIPDLEGIRSAIGRRVYEAAAEAAAAASQAEGIPLSNARMFDNFIDSVRRDVSTQVGDRVETVAHRISINLTPGGTVASAMRNRPAQFAQALREAGVNEDSELVEVSLNELADLVSDPTRAVQPAAQPEPAAQAAQAAQAAPAPFTTQDFSDWVQLVNTNLGFTEADRLVRVANRITTDIGAGTVGQALENNPTAFADALASAAREPGNEAISRALSDLADRIAPPVRDVNEPLPELNFEPDVGHPANQPTDIAAATDNQLVRNIEPGRFTEVNRMIDMAIADAQAVGVGPEEAYDTVSRGGVANIQGTPYELEYIARNVRAGLEFAEQQRQNQQRPQLNIDDIAFELFNDTRRGDDPNSPRNLEDLRTTLQALETGNFDDMRFRGYTPAEQNVMQSRVARAIREIMDDIGITLPAETQVPMQQQRPQLGQIATAAYAPIPDDVSNMMVADLHRGMTQMQLVDVNDAAQNIIQFNPDPVELQNIANMVHNHAMSVWENFSDAQRALLVIKLHAAASEALRNQEPPNAPPETAQRPDYLRMTHDAALEAARDWGTIAADEVRSEILNITEHLGIDPANNTDAFIARLRRAADTAALTSSETILRELADRMETAYMRDWEPPEEPTQRRGPFRPGGSSAVRGLPLGNLNIRPAINVESLRGPDVQPVRNFMQQVQGLPGVTQEGLRTGLMAFEQMDPARQISKADFVRELLPSSYDVVDLAGASQDNQHLIDAAEAAFDQDPSFVGQMLGLEGRQLEAWARALVQHANDFDSFPKSVKNALAAQGIDDAYTYEDYYADAYRSALETYATENGGTLSEGAYTYENVQRLVQPDMGDQYGEFGVTHPDQEGVMYHHYDLAPPGVIGHFRGTYNPADPITVLIDTSDGTHARRTFETKPNSYVIEEIQSDAQKATAQTGHLHQVHGVLFKAAVQKGLELGADTVYLPTAEIIGEVRDALDDNGRFMNREKRAKRYAPIYDQAIVKEGLKPLLKIPGVTSKVVNGYHEISFTPEAREYILNGPGQTIPGYQAGGSVKYPGFFGARDEAIERSEEMYGAHRQDDAGDAARHMLASGYMAQSLGPTVAKGLGWLHEFKEAPIRTAGHALGLSNPRYDYEMDMHNNALGIEMAQKAKNRTDFEQMVKDSIAKGTTATTPGRVRLMTPEQAEAGRGKLKYANGGTVSQTPSLDAMKYELMMRSK